MNINDKKEWVASRAGVSLAGLGDDAICHYYRAMHDYGMGFYDAERWAWLNTLIGYDIGADRAKGIIEWYEAQGLDVFDLTADDGGTLNNICSFELGYRIRFDAWAQEAPEAISFSWPDRPKVLA